MLGRTSLMVVVLAIVTLPMTQALASRTGGHHDGSRASAYHRAYRTGHRSYGVQYYHPGYVVGAPAARPTFWPDLGSVIYGYPYGTPCYRYNDRDWDYEWVC